MATMAQLRYSPLAGHFHYPPSPHYHRLHHNINIPTPTFCASQSTSITPSFHLYSSSPSSLDPNLQVAFSGGGGGGSISGNGGWSGSGGGGDDDSESSSPSSGGEGGGGFGPVGAFLNGWRSRVAADPQFPFKVLMEELVGVTACVIGDMASRPNFGLNELDFVFSTLVVGSILNFVLMYLLAPTAAMAGGGQSLPSIFSGCPPSHMFEPGAYGILSRMGTFVYKGTLFAGVGFAAGLVGTALSNGLIGLRKKMDPNFETPNKPPPTLLNALTWATHMGVSSNFRYQTLNGIEFLLAKGFPPFLFKSSVVVLRCLNNVLGGMTFVMLARLTGSQTSASAAADEEEVKAVAAQEESVVPGEKDKLLNEGERLQNSESAPSSN